MVCYVPNADIPPFCLRDSDSIGCSIKVRLLVSSEESGNDGKYNI